MTFCIVVKRRVAVIGNKFAGTAPFSNLFKFLVCHRLTFG